MSDAEIDRYCKIYVNAALGRDSLVRFISEVIGGTVERSIVTSSTMEIYVDDNDDFDSVKLKDPTQGFLFFPYAVDAEPHEGIAWNPYVEELKRLLKRLTVAGYQSVAACEFEEQLIDTK